LTDTEWKESSFAGISMAGNARLSEKSGNLKISGTEGSSSEGGFPIITDLKGSHLIPKGTYTGNEIDAVRITAKISYSEMTSSTTWRNVGIPYDSDIDITVEGPSNPVLTIEPGVVTKWAADTGLTIANANKGGLRAVGTKEQPIVFTGSLDKPGGWLGITFSNQAVANNTLIQNAKIEYAQKGLYLYGDMGPVVKDTAFSHNQYAVYVMNYEEGQTNYTQGLGNTFEDNGDDQNIE